MSVLALTRLQIITEGLSLAGRPDLLASARLWLSMYLEEMYLNQDFEWLVKWATGLSAANGVSIPTDYRAAKSAVLVHPNGATTPISMLSKPDEYDEKRLSMGETSGQPQYGFVNPQDRKFYFLPSPDQAYTLDLKYYYVPDIGGVEDDTDDDTVPTWRLPSSILVDHIKSRAFEYNDDQRQEGATKMVLDKVAQAKFNNHDRRAGPSRLPMGKRFTKRRF